MEIMLRDSSVGMEIMLRDSSVSMEIMLRDSSVSMEIMIPDNGGISSLRHRVHADSGAQPVSNQTGTGNFYPGSKMAGE